MRARPRPAGTCPCHTHGTRQRSRLRGAHCTCLVDSWHTVGRVSRSVPASDASQLCTLSGYGIYVHQHLVDIGLSHSQHTMLRPRMLQSDQVSTIRRLCAPVWAGFLPVYTPRTEPAPGWVGACPQGREHSVRSKCAARRHCRISRRCTRGTRPGRCRAGISSVHNVCMRCWPRRSWAESPPVCTPGN